MTTTKPTHADPGRPDTTSALSGGSELNLASIAASIETDPKIMIVDDATMTVRILQAFLEDAGYRRFVTTSQSTEALALAEKERPDAVLLDLHMPDVSGFEILEQIRSNYDIRHTPVIILTASDDASCKLRALELGATDFLAKPVDTSELALRLRNTLATKTYQDRLTHFDPLTDLPNRRLFLDRLARSLSRARRDDTLGAMLHVNLDRFRRLNATLEHAAGDHVLRTIARRLDRCVHRFDDRVSLSFQHEPASSARLGGDEFAVLLPEIASAEAAAALADDILAAVSKPIQWRGNDVVVTASIGLISFPNMVSAVPEAMRNVVLASSRARELGRNRFERYSTLCEPREGAEVHLESDLHRALARDELELFYQPKVDVQSGEIMGAEALLRWRHSRLGLISPARFIPLAEQCGLIVPIGAWVIRTVCEQVARWSSRGVKTPNIAFNVSGVQFRSSDLFALLKSATEETGIDPSFLTMELTESVIVDSTEQTLTTLHAIRSLGVRLALDDFGTGYSSLSYLERLPIDQLKVDMSFIRRIEAGASAPIVDAVIALAKSLGMNAVAEGVETEVQVDYLRERGCDQYQGFYFYKPLDVAAFSAALMKDSAPANEAVS